MDQESLRLDEATARALVLVQAIDEGDPQGRLLGDLEREQLEHQALEAAREGLPGQPLDRGRYLRERARRLLKAVEHRNPSIAGLQDPPAWRRWLPWLLPLAACALGAAIDRIDNPRQVNMLSPPLLAVLLWNLLAYLLLAVSPLLPACWLQNGPAAALQRWLAGATGAARRTGRLRTDVAARFHQLWWAATSKQQAQWGRQLLHATAAGWGAGLALSIAIGGLVREYRVGWESTLLEVQHVHAFLSVLFAPVVALLPVEGFTLHELHRMSFSSGAPVGVDEARRWVWLYLALLMVVVVAPRLLLAAFAGWRRRMLGRAVRVDLRDAYYTEVLARVSPARVVLCLLLRDGAGREMLLRTLRQACDQPALQASSPSPSWTVLTTSREDELRVIELPDRPPPDAMPALPAEPAEGGQGWLQDLWGRKAPAAGPRHAEWHQARAEGDLVLAVVSSPAALQAEGELLKWLGRPALVLVHDPQGVDRPRAEYEEVAHRLGLAADVLPLEPHTRSWLQDKALRDAIRQRLPDRKAPGYARIAAAWNERNQQRFEQSMRVLAGQLLHAARQAEDVEGTSLSLRQIVSASEREAGQRIRQAAMDRVLERLRAAESQAFGELLRLHGIAEPVGAALDAGLAEPFVVQQSVDSPQAGMAGAATGAAMGAGIDLLTGGLTLGAAAALGALVGGTAAFTAAHWKNRGTPGGGSQVQLSAGMLQSLTESALLRYLCVIHFGRSHDMNCVAPLPSWKSEVVAAVEAERQRLEALWTAARAGQDEGGVLHRQVAQVLQAIAGQVLARL